MNIDAVSFAILTALAAGPQHGYGILQDVAQLTGADRPPPVGSLYRVLDRLAGERLIEESGSDVVDGRFRRYYALTEHGAAALAEAADRQARVVRVARRRLRSGASAPLAVSPVRRPGRRGEASA